MNQSIVFPVLPSYSKHTEARCVRFKLARGSGSPPNCCCSAGLPGPLASAALAGLSASPAGDHEHGPGSGPRPLRRRRAGAGWPV